VTLDSVVGPRLDDGIATFDSDMTTRTQRFTDGDEHRVPARIVEEELGYVAGYDREVGPDFAQAKRVPFDPFHLFTACTAPGQGCTEPSASDRRLVRLMPILGPTYRFQRAKTLAG
jgi:hypothetical protein